MTSYKKGTALALVASLLLEGPLFAQVARTLILPSGGSGVPALAPGSIAQPLAPGFQLPSRLSAGTFLPPATLQAPAGAAKVSAQGASLALPPAAVQAAKAAVPVSENGPALSATREGTAFSRRTEPASLGQAERTRAAPAALRERLMHAASAIAQNPVSRRFFPGLSRLGAQVEDASKTEDPSLERAQAESHFGLKAFGADAGAQGNADTSGAPTKAPSGPAPAADTALDGWRNDGRPAEYEVRQVPFNGKSLPSTAFRPDTDIEPLLVEAIDAAKTDIRIALHEFKSHKVLRALRSARKRGVNVSVVVDFEYSFPVKEGRTRNFPARRDIQLQLLVNEGFDVAVLDGLWRYGIQHSRFALFDGKLAAFGSFRWVADSEANEFDTANFTDDARQVAGLSQYWEYMKSLSVPFIQGKAKAWPKEAPPPPSDSSLPIRHGNARLPAYFFSPGGAGEDWVVKAIESAGKTLDAAMFTFRSTRIAEALLAAKKRGVEVRALFDRSQSSRDYMKPYAEWLAHNGVAVKTIAGPDTSDKEDPGKNHTEFMVVDGALVETGSMNWTKNASLMNFESGHFLNDPKDAAAYAAFFDDLFASRKAKRLVPPGKAPALPGDAELKDELLKDPAPVPPDPVRPKLPPVGSVDLNGQALPSAAVRPETPVSALLAKAIDASQKSIRLALYEFTLQDVLEALLRAKARGVDVKILMDFSHVFPRGKDPDGGSQQRKEQIQALLDAGFDLRVLKGAAKQGTMHNKFAVFDGKVVEFGSYNWALTAEKDHFENAIFSDEAERVSFYEKYWDWMRSNSAEAAKAEDFDWTKARPGPAPMDPDQAIEHNGRRFPRQAFSPEGGVEEAVLRAVEAARTTIDIAMFSFYSQPIAEALLKAKERGVAVRLVLDYSQSRIMKLDEWFSYHGIEVKLLAGPDEHGPSMFEKNHNKFMIVDGELLETGSFNYTGNAQENNYENANFIKDAVLLAFYNAFFQLLYQAGWKAPKPATPPSAKWADPKDFFAQSSPEA